MSLTEEECKQSLNHLIQGAYSRWYIKHGTTAKPYYLHEKPLYKGDYKALCKIEQLINEHFELVKKIEWLKEEMTEPVFNLVFGTQDFFHNWYKGIQIYSVENTILKTKLSEYENPQPLRFEELHENMWVWDKRDNKYVRICRTRIYEYDTGCFYKGQKLLRIYCDSGWYDTEFIENRFYKREVKL